MPSLRCLISALTQAGRGGLLFRFASSVQSCYREGGALQTEIAVCGEHSPCSGHTGFAPFRGVCAFPIYTAQAPGCSIWSGPCVECGSSFPVLHKSADSVAPACCVFPASAVQAARGLRALSLHGVPFPSAVSGSGSQRFGWPLPRCGTPFPSAASGPGSQRFGRPRARRAFSLCGKPLRQPEACAHSTPCGRSFPSAVPARAAGRVSGSLSIGTGGLFAMWEGGGFSGVEFAPSPPPLPPSSSGDGPLFWSFSVSLF